MLSNAPSGSISEFRGISIIKGDIDMKNLKIALVSAALTIGLSGASSAGEVKQSSSMHLFEDLSIVENAKAELTRMDHGVYMNVQTNDLTPGNVVTM